MISLTTIVKAETFGSSPSSVHRRLDRTGNKPATREDPARISTLFIEEHGDVEWLACPTAPVCAWAPQNPGGLSRGRDSPGHTGNNRSSDVRQVPYGAGLTHEYLNVIPNALRHPRRGHAPDWMPGTSYGHKALPEYGREADRSPTGRIRSV